MDDPSEDLLFELFQDIARGDEDFFILERLDDPLENPQGGAA